MQSLQASNGVATLLGTKVDSITKEEALKRASTFLCDGRQHVIVTPNPEFLLLARRDKEFQSILNSADLALPDGVGILFAARVFGQPVRQRITGVRFVHQLCKYAAEQGIGVFLLGGKTGVAEKAVQKLKTRYPALRVVGAESGGMVRRLSDGQWSYENGNIPATIRQAKPEILFVALGYPKQEKWIADNLAHFPGVKIAVGIGGALDYIAGTASWAPAWVRRIGLEWLWRFAHEPWRWRRIFNAVIMFPLVVIYERFKK